VTNSHHLPCPAPSGQGAQHATGRPSFVRHQCQHSVPGRVDGDGMLQAVDVFFFNSSVGRLTGAGAGGHPNDTVARWTRVAVEGRTGYPANGSAATERLLGMTSTVKATIYCRRATLPKRRSR